MKKTLLIMVMALAVLLTQCRKPEVKFPSPVAPEGTTVSMTVTAGPGSKTDITHAGGITWSSGDRLYVGYNGAYVGYLTLTSGEGTPTGTFSGDVTLTGITEGTEKEFHFFYLGSTERTLEVGATEATVSFAEQNIYNDGGNLENASAQHVGYGSASGTVKDGIVTGINVTLVSKVALAHFSFKKRGMGYSNVLTLSGTNIYNEMTVNFAGTFTGKTNGNITLGSGNAERYVMLVPVGTGSETLSFAGDGFECSTILGSGIEPNKFYGREVAIEVRHVEFTVGMDGETPITVQFSPGNLQYWGDAVEKKWRFAEHQYEYFGSNGQGTTNETARRDLFGWGCTGYQDTRDNASTYQTNYQPYSVSASAVNETYNLFGYGPDYVSSPYYNLTVENKSDWGCNTIYTHCGDATGFDWRTLTGAEWGYLLETRTTAPTGIPVSSRYAMVKVDGKCGMMIFPDEFAWPSSVANKPETFNTFSSEWNGVDYGVGAGSDFEALEGAGVVFLPAAGYRVGTDIRRVGSYGDYWSSTCLDSDYAYVMGFYDGNVSRSYGNHRCYGFSVRLVR